LQASFEQFSRNKKLSGQSRLLTVGALLRYALYRFMQGIILLIHSGLSVRNLTLLLRQVIASTAQRPHIL
jgi:hypothetical protein